MGKQKSGRGCGESLPVPVADESLLRPSRGQVKTGEVKKKIQKMRQPAPTRHPQSMARHLFFNDWLHNSAINLSNLRYTYHTVVGSSPWGQTIMDTL
jgi:hypothetical protein